MSVRALLLALLCTLPAQYAHGKAKLRVLFLCTPNVACETFNKRLRGQTSDLPVHLSAAPFARAHEPGTFDDVASADQVAAAHDAAVVLWWREGALVALMRSPDSARVLVRPIARTPLLGTADLEAGSLVARTTIVATLNNTPVGIARPLPAASPAPLPPVPPSAASPWQVAPRLGWNAAWDGLPSEPTHGLEARIEGRWRALTLGALWIERPSVRLSVPEARGSLKSRALGLVLAYDFFVRKRWWLGAEARLGWLIARVQPLSGPLQDELRFARRFAGVGVRVRRELVPGRWAAWLAASLDHVEDPFSVGLRDTNSYSPLWYMWATQPSLGVGFELTFSR